MMMMMMMIYFTSGGLNHKSHHDDGDIFVSLIDEREERSAADQCLYTGGS